MRYTLTIDMDNAAFEGPPWARAQEVGRLLTKAIEDIEDDGVSTGDRAVLFDHNGNRVGHWEVTA